ncbi:MAG: hypothetical protein AAF985_11280 [Bacteroidota bacterium]
MSSKIIKKTGKKIILQIEVELDPNSMLNSEEQIAKVLNEAGLKMTKEALLQFDSDGRPIEFRGEKLTSKGQEKKDIKPPMGK